MRGAAIEQRAVGDEHHGAKTMLPARGCSSSSRSGRRVGSPPVNTIESVSRRMMLQQPQRVGGRQFIAEDVGSFCVQ